LPRTTNKHAQCSAYAYNTNISKNSLKQGSKKNYNTNIRKNDLKTPGF